MSRARLPAFALVIMCACSEVGDSPFEDPVDAMPAAVDAPPLGPTFSALDHHVFRPKCTLPCHSGGPTNAAGRMDLTSDTHAKLVGVAAQGSLCAASGFVRVAPGAPDESLLHLKIVAKAAGAAPVCGGGMPLGSNMEALPQTEIDLIEEWIAAGALDD